jgi:hypothetical protein
MATQPVFTLFLPSHSPLFARDRFDGDLVRDFLFAFSRAEYALKAAGFVRAGRYSEPRILWASFADEVASELVASVYEDVLRSRRYLVEHPPMKQVFSESGLKWHARARGHSQTEAQFLIESVTQVRNNLFHGGKELMGRLAERDQSLIEAALIMVAFAVSSHHRVAAFYEDAGPRVAA